MCRQWVVQSGTATRFRPHHVFHLDFTVIPWLCYSLWLLKIVLRSLEQSHALDHAKMHDTKNIIHPLPVYCGPLSFTLVLAPTIVPCFVSIRMISMRPFNVKFGSLK